MHRFIQPVPDSAGKMQSLLVTLLIATFHGVVRAFAWAPSLVYKVVMHKIAFMHWLFGGSW